MGSETRAFLTGFEERLDAKLAGLEERTDAKFVALETRLSTRIEESQEALAGIVTGQFDAVDRRFDGLKGAFEGLEGRVGVLAVAVEAKSPAWQEHTAEAIRADLDALARRVKTLEQAN